MKTVYKYPLVLTDVNVVVLPPDAEILSVQEQPGQLALWALVDPSAPHIAQRTICIAGTGHPLDSSVGYRHISTFQMHGGNLVFHAFEVLNV